MRAVMAKALSDPEQGVLIVDGTSFVKKGTKSAGVAPSVLGYRRPDREFTGRRICGVCIPARVG